MTGHGELSEPTRARVRGRWRRLEESGRVYLFLLRFSTFPRFLGEVKGELQVNCLVWFEWKT